MSTFGGAFAADDVSARIHETVRHIWGYDRLRPLQDEAIRAGLDRRDSVVVLPTGGGKSLCYQVPPVVKDRTDLVISPLISLMKDQVDGLQANGYPAASLHSGMTETDRRAVHDGLRNGRYRLLFVSPERVVRPSFADLLGRIGVESFVIDEAHCISQWGHDFRPEYRQLSQLKERFEGASVHAFTATATPRVRQDIVDQLKLDDPTVLVGIFDRPNLVYRIVPRTDLQTQVLEILRRHAGEAVIVYCLARKDTESLAAMLAARGVRAAAYHAGLEKARRNDVQEAFSREQLDVVTATVAFGMGIDRSNVRCVVHAAMPKSIEHYQQETGRAGRDGLEAECTLLYSAADAIRWEGLIEKSAAEVEEPNEVVGKQRELLRHMQGLCQSLECRHRALSRYFGQAYEREGCGACDVCLDEVESLPDATVVAQKILSCVYRLGQRFGIGYTVDVLRGTNGEIVHQRGHAELSTAGLLAHLPAKAVTNLVYQLIDQGLIARTAGDRPVLMLNEESIEVLRGEREVRLRDPGTTSVRRSRQDLESWEGVDRGLFDRLRSLRLELADTRGVPAYVIFSDATLRELARVRPKSLDEMRLVHGVGEKKLADFGAVFLRAIESDVGERIEGSTTSTPTPPAR